MTWLILWNYINIQPTASDYCMNYHFPENLPFGDYTVRVNATTLDATSTSSDPINPRAITGSSPPIHVNALFANQSLGCGKGQVPNSWQNLSSVNSSYTSLRLTAPYPGMNLIVQDDPKAQVDLSWTIRDDTNGGMNGITNITFQFLQTDGKTTVGSPITLSLDEATAQTYRVDADIVPFNYGAYKVGLTYYNKFQDGLVAPGNPVNFVSEEFNIVRAGVDCSTQSAGIRSMNVHVSAFLISSFISLGLLVLGPWV